MTPASDGRRAPPLGVAAAFAVVCVVWGTTFLGLKISQEGIPTLLTGAVQYWSAGLLLTGWAVFRGARRPTPAQWRGAAGAGALYFLCAHGATVLGVRRAPSGIACVLAATIPIWAALLQWRWRGGPRPSAAVWAGLAVGFGGVAWLVGPGPAAGGLDPVGAALLLVGPFCWAAGTVYAAGADLPATPLLSSGLQMLLGASMLALAAGAKGEWSAFHPAALSGRVLGAEAYLILVGGVLTFACYTWLLGVAPAPWVASYAFVNPVVALVAGRAIGGEPLTARTLGASALVLAAVALITVADLRAARGTSRSRAGMP